MPIPRESGQTSKQYTDLLKAIKPPAKAKVVAPVNVSARTMASRQGRTTAADPVPDGNPNSSSSILSRLRSSVPTAVPTPVPLSPESPSYPKFTSMTAQGDLRTAADALDPALQPKPMPVPKPEPIAAPSIISTLSAPRSNEGGTADFMASPTAKDLMAPYKSALKATGAPTESYPGENAWVKQQADAMAQQTTAHEAKVQTQMAANPPTSGAQMVDWAKHYLGTSGYTQGASNRFPNVGRADCSAFVDAAAYNVTGNYIGGRDSNTVSQRDWFSTHKDASGSPMWLDGPAAVIAAKPGDAVYYDGHVALYAGNGQVISNGGDPITTHDVNYRPVIGVGRSSTFVKGATFTPTAPTAQQYASSGGSGSSSGSYSGGGGTSSGGSSTASSGTTQGSTYQPVSLLAPRRVSTPAPMAIPTWLDPYADPALTSLLNNYLQPQQDTVPASYMSGWKNNAIADAAATAAGNSQASIAAANEQAYNANLAAIMSALTGDSKTSVRDYHAKVGEYHRGIGQYGLQPQMDDALERLMSAMHAAGVGVPKVLSGFRDKSQQTVLKLAKKSVQPAGKSIHGIGLAVDLGQTPEQTRWLDIHAGEFGLRRRQSEDNHWELDPKLWNGRWAK